ncbi:hypothetical protein SAMN05421747_113111 [Parapedobacter composti]|uniref:Uncharacterized protein n=1 Tax=Parapedobacter composti TaxID=623281 RepID=A0A1I1JXJ6_9SPHI|nr:hypothetical protein SAMN05421747_113111 [Parapedobacter composti]
MFVGAVTHAPVTVMLLAGKQHLAAIVFKGLSSASREKHPTEVPPPTAARPPIP